MGRRTTATSSRSIFSRSFPFRLAKIGTLFCARFFQLCHNMTFLCGERAQILWHHPKSFPGWPERYYSKFLLLAQKPGAVRFGLGYRPGLSLPDRNPSISWHGNILNRSDRSGTETNGWLNRGRTHESALVRRDPGESTEL